MPSDRAMCPSSRCEPGAVLLGVIVGPGTLAYASDRLVVDEEFVQIARAGRSPEKRFRFSARCVQSACRQWTGTRCGVIDAVLPPPANSPPPFARFGNFIPICLAFLLLAGGIVLARRRG